MKTQTAQSKTSAEDVGRGALLMALELSAKRWRVAFTERDASKVREVSVEPGDWPRLEEAISKAKVKLGLPADGKTLCCYEAGRDGFWVHRFLVSHGVANMVLDSSSILVDRRARRAKTDGLDALQLLELLVRHVTRKPGTKLRGFKIVTVPSVDEEDARRLHRERERLVVERGAHQSRMKALLALHGIRVEDARAIDVEALRTWDGSALPRELAAELEREHERILLVDSQLKSIHSERSTRQKLVANGAKETGLTSAQQRGAETAHRLNQLIGIGPTGAWLLAFEMFWRTYENRRQVGGSTGLCGTPYDSGDGEREQGISKAGSPLVRKLLVELAWSWLRFQPQSGLARWFQEKFGRGGSRMRRIGIVALARRLAVDLWRFVQQGIVPEAARLRAQKA